MLRWTPGFLPCVKQLAADVATCRTEQAWEAENSNHGIGGRKGQGHGNEGICLKRGSEENHVNEEDKDNNEDGKDIEEEQQDSELLSWEFVRFLKEVRCSNCKARFTLPLTLTVLVTTIEAQWEGMGDVGSARYELALLPPCPTIRVLSYSN